MEREIRRKGDTRKLTTRFTATSGPVARTILGEHYDLVSTRNSAPQSLPFAFKTASARARVKPCTDRARVSGRGNDERGNRPLRRSDVECPAALSSTRTWLKAVLSVPSVTPSARAALAAMPAPTNRRPVR